MSSSRNRPERWAKLGEAGAAARAFGDALGQSLTGGYPPSEVADQVLRGIREERFYVLPSQPEITERAMVRAQDVLALRNPTPRRG
jgi:hypothetical protein